MQFDQAEFLRKTHKGPCDHPRIDKVYFGGGDMEEYACTTCGKSFDSYDEWRNDGKPAEKSSRRFRNHLKS